MLQEYLTLNIVAFLLVFARVGAAFVTMPGFSAGYVPETVRLTSALLISFAVMPTVTPALPAMPTSAAAMVLLLAGEVLVGAVFGLIGRVFLSILSTAGTLIALFASLANAFVRDPIAEEQSSVFSGFLVLFGLVLVFATDTHHVMIRAVIDSYTLFKPGVAPPLDDFSSYMAHVVSETFGLGVRMSAPLLVAGIAYYLGLGLLGRLMPALPVFFFGLPVQVAMQLAILMLAFPGMMLVFINYYEAGYRAFVTP